VTPQEEVREAYASFAQAFKVYQIKLDRGYRFVGDGDCDLVSGAWNKYLRLRKQHGDYR
jgi:hypothetical protein